MQDLQIYDYMRLLIALLACVAAYRLGRRVKDGYKTYSTRLGEWVWILFAVLFTQFTGAIENVAKDTEWRYGSLLSFFIAAAAVRASRPGGPLQRFPTNE